MANEIVKYNNDLSNLRLSNFTASERNLLMSLCYVCKDKECEIIDMPYKELEKLSQFSGKSRKKFLEELHAVARKLHQLSMEQVQEDGKFKMFHLFETFEALDNDLRVGVSKDFTYILNEFELGNYTSFELAEFTGLKSSYSKDAYRQLKKFKYGGFWKVDIKEFRRLLDIPDSYIPGDINRKVIKQIEKELPNYFEDLKIEVLKEERNGTKITGYLFKWKPEKAGSKYIGKGFRKIRYECPICGGELYEIEKSDGTVFIGHKDGWKDSAICKKTFSTIAEVVGRKEMPDRSDYDDYEDDKTDKEPSNFVDVISETVKNVDETVKLSEKEEELFKEIPELERLSQEMGELHNNFKELLAQPASTERTEKKKAIQEEIKKKKEIQGKLLREKGYSEDYLD